jgi:hypothetical protein
MRASEPTTPIDDAVRHASRRRLADLAQTDVRRALVPRQLGIDDLMAIVREMNANSRTRRWRAAEGGTLLRLLDFAFISRRAPPGHQ